MAESINARIDNTALGSFVMDQIGATLDLARSLTKLIPGGSVLQGAVTTSGAPSSAQKALVKITTIDFVVPGLYPIYKPRELLECMQRSQSASDGGCSGGSPGWGNSIQFRTRTDVVLQLVTTSPGTGDASPANAGVSAENSAAVNTALTSAAQDQVNATGIATVVTVKNVVGDIASGQIAVTVVCPDANESDTVKKAAGKALPPKVFQKAMPSAKTVTVQCDNGA